MGKLDEFMKAAPAPLNGNSAWASRYAGELRRVFHEHAARAPRSLQSHLGPSELGAKCHRQVAGKLAHLPTTNHVADPWPSIVGTALHAWAADAFLGDNERRQLALWQQAVPSGTVAGASDLHTAAYKEWARQNGVGIRWVAEQRVVPHPDHPGTADLYDAIEESVDDHKFLGEGAMAKVRSPEGPPRHYVVQLLLYGRGYRLMGLPVRRVVLAAYPRTAASLDGLYVWEREHTSADDDLLEHVFKETEYRKQWAIALVTGAANLMDVPAATDNEECYFCPFFRPQAAKDHGTGCPGHVGNSNSKKD